MTTPHRTARTVRFGRHQGFAVALAVIGLALMIGVGYRVLLAQDLPSTPAAGEAGQVHNHAGRPTHLYAGACSDFGEAQIALNPVGAGTMQAAGASDAAGMAIGARVGSPDAVALERALTTIPESIADLTAAPLAMVVQRDEYTYGDWIACGDVGGAQADGMLAFGLEPLANSGFSGVAILRETTDGTTVEVFVTSPDAALATPAP